MSRSQRSIDPRPSRSDGQEVAPVLAVVLEVTIRVVGVDALDDASPPGSPRPDPVSPRSRRSHLAAVSPIGAAPSATKSPAVFEQLTSREKEVLSYLPSHLSQRQIAQRMILSDHTVKSHIKNIYRKTGTGSRSEAVSVAQALGWL